jgi:hypothetical protein
MKRWTRAGIIPLLDNYLDSEQNETILVIGGKGPIFDHILNKRNVGTIKTLDINPDHHADYTIDIADQLVIEKSK